MTQRPAFGQAARALLRDTVLDATGELLREHSWAQVTMAQVAKAAGVSRQTLYNEFGDRQGLGQAYLLREGERLLGAVQASIDVHRDAPRSALEAAFATFLADVQDSPILEAIADPEGGEGLLALLTTQGEPVLAFARARLAAMLTARWPQVTAADAEALAEHLVRLAISHAALPTGTPQQAAATVAGILAPHLDALLGRSALAA